jgi:hypothetical protein
VIAEQLPEHVAANKMEVFHLLLIRTGIFPREKRAQRGTPSLSRRDVQKLQVSACLAGQLTVFDGKQR